MRTFLLMLASLPAVAAAPVELGHDAWLIPGEFVAGRQPDGNSVLLRGPDGWIVVDSGRHAAHTQRVLDHVRASGAPLVTVVNTHWHLDHVSGNPMLRAKHPGLRVVATGAIDAALGGFLARSREQLQAMLAQPGDPAQQDAMREEVARIEQGDALRPDEVIVADGERVFAGRALQVRLTSSAVTQSDAWLYDDDAKLLIAGDLVTLPAPFLDTACAPRWQAQLARVEATDFEMLVPGHGAPMTRMQFRTWRGAFDGLLECAASKAAPGDCAARWSKDAGDLLDGHDAALTRGLVEYYVGQRLRGEGATADCPA